MSKLKFLGDIVHTEKYEKDGEEKKKYTNAGALFQREDGSYCIKQFDTWFNVYAPRANEQDYAKAKRSVQATPDPGAPLENEILF